MGRKPEITELPTRFLMAALESGGRRKRTVGAVVAGAVVASVAGVLVLRNMEAAQQAALDKQWGLLQGCILGEELRAGETPSSRARAVQLTVVGIPRSQRAKPGELGWPANCASPAAWLAEHADAAPTSTPEFKTSAQALAAALKEDQKATAEIGPLLDSMWKSAAAAGLHAPTTPDATVPKPASPILPRDVLRSPSWLSGDFAVGNIKLEPSPGKDVRFLVDDNALAGGAVLCTGGGVPPSLGCKTVGAEAAKHTQGLSLEGATDPEAEPWIFAGERGQVGVFRPGGAVALSGAPVVGSWVDKDGSAWLLVHPAAGQPADVQLVHAPATGDVLPGRPVLDPGEIDGFADASLAWDWVIARSGAKAHPPTHLLAHKLSDKGDLGPAVDVGDAATLDRPDRDDRHPRFSSCRGPNTMAVRVHGPRGDAVTFFTGGVWTAPVPLNTRGGQMACQGNEAVITQTWSVADSDGPHPMLEQTRCNTSACTPTRLSFREMLAETEVLPQEGASFAAADVGKKLLVVWNAGATGGMRMRLAPIDRLKTTPDEVVIDTRDPSGQSDITQLRLLPWNETALLVVNTTKGARVLRIDGAGKISLLPIRG